jgi:SP family general alpha glucoside:H+ symporter-like MFS transporter
MTTGLIFIQFFARSLPVLLVGELLGGLILGTYTTIAPTYASEVCPMALRGHLTAYINLCFVMGQLMGNGVMSGTSPREDHWAYSVGARSRLHFLVRGRWCAGNPTNCRARSDFKVLQAPFAIQWLWPAIILAGILFAPESPWWYVRKGRLEGHVSPCISSDISIISTTLAFTHWYLRCRKVT